jgi:hypothetical protein
LPQFGAPADQLRQFDAPADQLRQFDAPADQLRQFTAIAPPKLAQTPRSGAGSRSHMHRRSQASRSQAVGATDA